MKWVLAGLFWLWISLVAGLSVASDTFEIVAEFTEAPGNIAVARDGRIFMSLHQFYEPRYSVVEVLPDHSIVPFPNSDLNQRNDTGKLRLDSVLGIQADNDGIVWMLDNGLRSEVAPKLVAWDTRKNRLHRVIYFTPPSAPANAFVNDLAVDKTRNRIFISDPAGGDNAALIVVDLETGLTQRVLEGERSVIPENLDLLIDGRPLRMSGPDGKIIQPHIGVNPIAEDSTNEWVYFGAMHGQSLFRIPAVDLADMTHDAQSLANKVEKYSEKPISDGIAMDHENNIYLGQLESNAIGVVTPNKKYIQLAQSPKLSWVDSLAVGPDGWVYAVVNQLHLSAPLNAGEKRSKPPYYLVRMRPLNLNEL